MRAGCRTESEGYVIVIFVTFAALLCVVVKHSQGDRAEVDDKKALLLREDVKRQAVISIGLHTNALLDCLLLPDKIIIQICNLVTTTRSSCWVDKFKEAPFSMTLENAVSLASTILEDLKETGKLPEVNHFCFKIYIQTSLFKA